jgi:hypothetical protein
MWLSDALARNSRTSSRTSPRPFAAAANGGTLIVKASALMIESLNELPLMTAVLQPDFLFAPTLRYNYRGQTRQMQLFLLVLKELCVGRCQTAMPAIAPYASSLIGARPR